MLLIWNMDDQACQPVHG